jgi:uncharacterized NAD(P)/FAD-binding protein YdhS
VLAGKLQRVQRLDQQGVAVTWRPRGAVATQRLEAALVINCTGPSTDVACSTEPLIAALSAQGLVRADPMRLGLDLDAGHRVLDALGRAHPALFAVGPITRGALWEINAVPDIRLQAAQVAAEVVRALGPRRA